MLTFVLLINRLSVIRPAVLMLAGGMLLMARSSYAQVKPDYGGTSSVAVDLESGQEDNAALLSSPGTTISLPKLQLGKGPDEGLYVALFVQGHHLKDPWCKWNVRGLDPIKTVGVLHASDTIYVFMLAHGDSVPQPGQQKLVCGWSNPAIAGVGAISFKGVQTWPAEYDRRVSVQTGETRQPFIDIPTEPNHMTLAFMMHGTSAAGGLKSQTRTLQWAISGEGANGVATTEEGASGPVRHRFVLSEPAPWAVVGIDVPNQPANIEQRWLAFPAADGRNEPPSGVQSLTLSNFEVGQGENEYMVVGITSPGELADLQVTWGDQAMSQIDAYPIPGEAVLYCRHFSWKPNGRSPCDRFGPETQAYLYWYGLKLPHAGKKRLQVSWINDVSGSFEPLIDAMALSFANVDQAQPYRNVTHAGGSVSGRARVSLQIRSGGPGDMTVALLADHGATIWCDPSQTSNAPSVGHGIGFASSRAPGGDGGIVTHSWVRGTGPANNDNVCGRAAPADFPINYGMSGFDLVEAKAGR